MQERGRLEKREHGWGKKGWGMVVWAGDKWVVSRRRRSMGGRWYGD